MSMQRVAPMVSKSIGNYLSNKKTWSMVFNVKDYGAEGDGTTDDTSSINSAIAAAEENGGGVVMLPPGTYLVNQSLVIPENVYVRGSGMGITNVIYGTEVDLFNLSDNSGVSDMTVDGRYGSLGFESTGILVDDADGCVVERVESKDNGFHGIAIQRGSYNCIINCYVHGNQHRGILMDPSASHNIVDTILAENNVRADILIGHGSHHNVVNNVLCKDTDDANIWVHMDSHDNQVSNVNIKYTLTDNDAPGIFVGSAKRNRFSNIIVDGRARGIMFRGLDLDVSGYTNGDTEDNELDGFTFNLNGSIVPDNAGIWFDSTSATYVPKNNSISNGKIIGSYDGIRDATGNATGNQFNHIRLKNITNQKFRMGNDYGNSRVFDIDGYTPFGSLATETAHPAIPATGVAVANPFPFTCTVYVYNMTSGGVVINGSNTNAPSFGNGAHIVGPGQTITLTYSSGTPAWRWFGNR